MGKLPVSPATKPERKASVRKSPMLKDYPNKLAWLKAMTAYEESQSEVTSAAKVVRLDKRIKAKKVTIARSTKELAVLEEQRAALVPAVAEDAAPTA